MARFIIQREGQAPLLFELLKPRITVGRSEGNDLALDDVNVSRLHMVVELTPQGYRVTDQNSRNGILVAGQRCQSVLLQNGSTLQVADTTLRFEDSTDAWKDTTVFETGAASIPMSIGESALRHTTEVFRRAGAQPIPAGTPSAVVERLREAERRALLFEVLGKAAGALQIAMGQQEVLDTVVRLVFDATQAERVLVMLWDEEKQCLNPAVIQASSSSSKKEENQVALSQTLLSSVLQSRKAVLVRDAAADPRFYMRESVSRSGLRSAICSPMAAQDRLYGLIYADNCRLAQVFEEDDLQVLSVVALEAALALDSLRAREEILQQERVRLAYRRFLPEHVADQLLAAPDAVQLGGSRCEITALFSDLRGFTSLAERLPPEEAVDLLNAFFTGMAAIIFRMGGTLDKFLGDGLLAVFGAPLPEPKHALLAVECAISMQTFLNEIATEWRRIGRPVIPMGIGVNTGEAIAGNIGSPQRMEYTVIGDVVNLAARLTAQAGPGEILLGESTWAQVKAEVAAEALPLRMIKGKRDPAQIYRVLYS